MLKLADISKSKKNVAELIHEMDLKDVQRKRSLKLDILPSAHVTPEPKEVENMTKSVRHQIKIGKSRPLALQVEDSLTRAEKDLPESEIKIWDTYENSVAASSFSRE